ncbi:hypothetical protein VTP01DRAFT_9124 [Rhizomucor pusillus]|uniref:uncharacterized protein n=1 Tax=Rhizomucor pusillus TaxID=4840 RepID=UPI0037444237
MSAEATTQRYIDLSLIPETFEAFSPNGKSPLDLDSLKNDDDKELWLIRVPDNFPVDKLADAKLQVPSADSGKKALGKINVGKDKYEFFRVPENKGGNDNNNDDGDDAGVSGHEMAGLTCLLPQKDGKLGQATKEFAHRLIVNQVVDIPDSTEIAKEIRDRPLEKRQQPEGLKMRFKPYGFDTRAPKQEEQKPQETATKAVKQEDGEKKSKKRRKESDDGDKTSKKKKKKESKD